MIGAHYGVITNMAARIRVHLFIYECIISVFSFALTTAERTCALYFLTLTSMCRRRGKKLFPPFSRAHKVARASTALMAIIMIIISYDFFPLLPSYVCVFFVRSCLTGIGVLVPAMCAYSTSLWRLFTHSLSRTHNHRIVKSYSLNKKTHTHTLLYRIKYPRVEHSPSHSHTHFKPSHSICQCDLMRSDRVISQWHIFKAMHLRFA